jgi:hypothetical protein
MKKRKIIFLDIDGVLNHEQWFWWRYYNAKNGNNLKDLYIEQGYSNRESFLLTMIDERSVANLNYIIKETGADIVLSSTWRSNNPDNNKETNKVLNAKGLVKEFFDVTPYCGMRRGIEIAQWLNAQDDADIINYVIIDDDSDMLDNQKDNFVNTDAFVGLTWFDAEKAIEILNKNDTL